MNGTLGYPITCEVCPHHLFFTEEDVETKLGDKKGQVRPCLSTKEDRDFLLKNLEYIDTIGSDHAPHTVEEKTGKNGKSIILDIYSEKTTKFCEISTLLLSFVVPVKSKVEISQNLVAFSEYMNFTT